MDRAFEVSEWIRYADNDTSVVNILATHHPLLLEIICYHCQQSAEKMLKAFWIHANKKPPKTHDLELLRAECEIIANSFAELFHECERLNRYSSQPRYPLGLEIVKLIIFIIGHIKTPFKIAIIQHS